MKMFIKLFKTGFYFFLVFATLSAANGSDETAKSNFKFLGWCLAKQAGLNQLQLNKSELRSLYQGIESELHGKQYAAEEAKILVDQLEAFFKQRNSDDTIEPDSNELNNFEFYGWCLAKQGELGHLELTKLELESFYQGIEEQLDGISYTPDEMKSLLSQLDTFFTERTATHIATQQKSLDMESKENQDKAVSFYDQLRKNPNIKETASGLFYEILEPGKGKFPTVKDAVKVHYEGRLIDNTVFDSSYNRGQPATFGLQAVIPGFQEGLQLINPEGKIRLYIPPQLGYGNRRLPNIPAGSILIFDIELLAVVADS
jgi:FKBP-type peptidyl-prolyl cis-trans isomerase